MRCVHAWTNFGMSEINRLRGRFRGLLRFGAVNPGLGSGSFPSQSPRRRPGARFLKCFFPIEAPACAGAIDLDGFSRPHPAPKNIPPHMTKGRRFPSGPCSFGRVCLQAHRAVKSVPCPPSCPWKSTASCRAVFYQPVRSDVHRSRGARL